VRPTRAGERVTAWDDLVSIALVGTERKPMPDHVAAATATALGAQPPTATTELRVLTAAGVLAATRRAGWTPPHGDAAPDPSPADDRPVASATAVQLLELLATGQVPIQGSTTFLVADWLQRAADTGRRPPDRLLPQLLTLATAAQSIRPELVAAGGPRLHWLAARNDEWSWAATTRPDEDANAADAERVWTTGDRDARLHTLGALRRTDRAQARELLADTWPTESAKDRERILTEVLAADLGPDDEAFLEAALDDRSKVVRLHAAVLLAGLPTSRLAARMAGRLRPLVQLAGRIRKHVEVSLPDDLDAAARRDGIVDAGAPAKLGTKAWRLVQIVAATPLGFWPEHLGVTPKEVGRVADSQELLLGLTLAATRQHDAAWAAALLAHHADPSLLAVLPPDQVDAVLPHALAAVKDEEVGRLIGNLLTPWSMRTSQAVVARLRAGKAKTAVHAHIPTLATGLDPAVAPDVEAWVDDLRGDEHTRRHLRSVAHALTIRQTIAQELP
jgi:hypothetical protein